MLLIASRHQTDGVLQLQEFFIHFVHQCIQCFSLFGYHHHSFQSQSGLADFSHCGMVGGKIGRIACHHIPPLSGFCIYHLTEQCVCDMHSSVCFVQRALGAYEI
ncbi:hypothetical protein AX13_05080 [Comamonas aquatica DA1877]|uniref:Uncharacterized protein n=1 Tax=Comamonas aquatica DA1877 TaxID=1457173 RepID=A0A014MCG6_9BURK|nr:hypothetical protein AX13_05080 [Comamonas aquatica DA1877]